MVRPPTRKRVRPTRLIDCYIFKFYVPHPKYRIQSRPIPVRARLGFRQALYEAADRWLVTLRKPKKYRGEIYPKHEEMVDNPEYGASYEVRRRKITDKQFRSMRRAVRERHAKKTVGWKRSYRRR